MLTAEQFEQVIKLIERYLQAQADEYHANGKINHYLALPVADYSTYKRKMEELLKQRTLSEIARKRRYEIEVELTEIDDCAGCYLVNDVAIELVYHQPRSDSKAYVAVETIDP